MLWVNFQRDIKNKVNTKLDAIALAKANDDVNLLAHYQHFAKKAILGAELTKVPVVDKLGLKAHADLNEGADNKFKYEAVATKKFDKANRIKTRALFDKDLEIAVVWFH